MKHITKKTIFIAILTLGLSVIMDYCTCSDNYFMIAHGKDILENGPWRATDIFSMHQDFAFLHQKWIMCIAAYSLYKYLGTLGLKIGAYILGVILYGTLFYLSQKLCPKYEYIMTTVCTLFIFPIAILGSFRPHMIGMTLTAIEIYLIERYINQKLSSKHLVFYLVITSVIWMWCHSTMWILCLIYMLPYICNIKINNCITKADYNKKPLIIGFISVMISSLLQPNGWKQIPYMIACTTATDKRYRMCVDELNPLTPADQRFVFLILGLGLFVILWIKLKQIRTEHALLIGGSVIMSIMSKRMVMYLFCVIIIISAILINELPDDDPQIAKLKSKSTTILTIIINTTVMIFMVVTMIFMQHFIPSDHQTRGYYAIDMIKEHAGDQYTTYFTNIADNGSYGIMLGLHPYIDCRMETYDIKVNKQKDILSEYIDFIGKVVEHKDDPTDVILSMQNKYKFDYWIINKYNNISDLIINTLKQNANCVYEDDKFVIISFNHKW